MRTSKWLKEMRKKFNLSQKQLSEESGVNKLTIENLEQGRRKGSDETWELIETYFNKKKNDPTINISIDSEDIIEELKQDIEEFGEDCKCVLIYKIEKNHFIFTNYDFITDEKPFNPDEELEKNEYYLITNLKYALDIFEKQNKI